MSTIIPPFLLPEQLQNTSASQSLHYVAASVYIVLLLEHLASFPQEVEFIWKAPGNFARVSFLLYRYSTLVGLTILMHLLAGFSGPLEDNLFVFCAPTYKNTNDALPNFSCKQAVATLAALAVLSMGIADALVMLRVSVLWGRRRFILVIFLFSFFITYSTEVVCAVIVAAKLVAAHTDVRCAHFAKPHAIFGVWVPGMVFDGLVLSFTGWNACARPRTRETALTMALHRDGVAFFLILAGLRSVNFFMSIFSPVFLVNVCITWALSAITLSRFIFHLRCLEKKQDHDSDDLHDIDVVEDADADSNHTVWLTPLHTVGGATRHLDANLDVANLKLREST